MQKKMNAETVAVIVTQTTSDAHLLELAIERNAAHGPVEPGRKKQAMAQDLPCHAGKRTHGKEAPTCQDFERIGFKCASWLSRIDKDAKDARDKRIFSKWLACWTQDEIAESEGISVRQFRDLFRISRTGKLPKSSQTLATYSEPDWTPIYNVWKQQTKTPGVDHFGNSEVRLLDNLLYLYTDPFDVIVDPFAGRVNLLTCASAAAVATLPATVSQSWSAKTTSVNMI